MQYKNSIKTAEWGNVGVLAILSKQQLSSAYKFPLKFSITFFEFSLGLNHFNYFFDVVLTETLECFKNISMFCGMKVRLQRRRFSLSLD